MPPTATSPLVKLRWGIRRDLADMLAIEQASFPCPWSEEDFLSLLKQRNVISMVAVPCEKNGLETGGAVGLFIYELHKTHLRLLTVAVHPDRRREGIGTMMLESMRGKLSTHRRRSIVAAVWERNLDAQLFLRVRMEGYPGPARRRRRVGRPVYVRLSRRRTGACRHRAGRQQESPGPLSHMTTKEDCPCVPCCVSSPSSPPSRLPRWRCPSPGCWGWSGFSAVTEARPTTASSADCLLVCIAADVRDRRRAMLRRERRELA